MKNILVCFDGTGNEPEDGVQQIADSGEPEDDNISNVLKLYLRSGGRLDAPQAWNNQLSLYYRGPGTRGSGLRRTLVSGVASRSLDMILRLALTDLRNVYESGDQISVFGFSRGAAIARRFVAHLQGMGLTEDEKNAAAVRSAPVPVRFMGVWDTVLSEGTPEKNRKTRATELVGEPDGIGESVESVCHLVSIDDPRKVFTPTLFQPDSRVEEVWFAGVHSDIGGGYAQSGLSDITLEFMLSRAADRAGLQFMNPEDAALVTANESGHHGPHIGLDDLASAPSAEADDHAAGFDKFLKEFSDALGARHVVALGAGTPVLHETVIQRAQRRSDYRPDNLANLAHHVYGKDTVFTTFQEHLQTTS